MPKLTVAQAAEQWIAAKKAIAREKPKLNTAAEVLKEHFRSTGRHTYKDAISYAVVTREQLDTEKVKAELGAKLPRFQKTVEAEQLSLIK